MLGPSVILSGHILTLKVKEEMIPCTSEMGHVVLDYASLYFFSCISLFLAVLGLSCCGWFSLVASSDVRAP